MKYLNRKLKPYLRGWVVILFTFTFQSTAIAQPSGLVSWWPAEGNANDIQDSNDGTLQNGASFAPGLLGQAFSLDGSNDHVTVPDASNLDFTDALTIEAWVFPTGFVVSYPTIVSKWDAIAVNHRSYILHLDAVGRVFFRASPNGYEPGFGLGTVISNTRVPLNEWSHVVGVYDGASMRVYINGVLDQQVNYDQGIFPGENDLAIGAVVGGVGTGQQIAPFSGLIDEVKIYGCGLSASDVASTFNTGSTSECQKITALIDIKPGSDLNSINLCSNGGTPVAILGSDSFDVYEVDTETLRFAEASVKMVGKKDPHTLCSIDDVNNDLFDDLVCHYLTTDIAALDGESTTATINGELFDGTPIDGVDSVSIVKDTCN